MSMVTRGKITPARCRATHVLLCTLKPTIVIVFEARVTRSVPQNNVSNSSRNMPFRAVPGNNGNRRYKVSAGVSGQWGFPDT